MPTFRRSCCASARIFHELRKVMGTRKSMILVPLLFEVPEPVWLLVAQELQIGGTSAPYCIQFLPRQPIKCVQFLSTIGPLPGYVPPHEAHHPEWHDLPSARRRHDWARRIVAA